MTTCKWLFKIKIRNCKSWSKNNQKLGFTKILWRSRNR